MCNKRQIFDINELLNQTALLKGVAGLVSFYGVMRVIPIDNFEGRGRLVRCGTRCSGQKPSNCITVAAGDT